MGSNYYGFLHCKRNLSGSHRLCTLSLQDTRRSILAWEDTLAFRIISIQNEKKDLDHFLCA